MSTSNTVLGTIPTRNRDHVLRTIVTCRSGAAQVLAAQERHQLAIAVAARTHLARQAGIAPTGIGTLLASARRLTGAALIWAGEWLHGRSVGYPATTPMPGA